MTPPPANATPLLSIEDLAVSFPAPDGGRVFAVNGVSLDVHPGRTLAVVGESGSGKSVTAMSVLRLLQSPPARYERGRIMFRAAASGVDLLKLPERELRRVRGGKIAMIFQEPMTSLNPVYTIGEQIIEAISLHQGLTGRDARDAAASALAEVGIDRPAHRLRAYPHEFSGGMRQRVMIAMALACKPVMLIADEPTTALDVTIQAQVLELLRTLREQSGLAMMLITHALGVVAENADTVCVMYAGRVLEYASVQDLFDRPLHPYTRGLMRSIPSASSRVSRLATVAETVNNPAEFERLPGAKRGIRPWWPGHPAPADSSPAAGPTGEHLLHEVNPGHWVACWRTRALATAALG
ncbi:MAG: ABC transporter ATP-binding protein [Phycisphaerae bacterium]|nr:ABC transporter ATP-binding protein [Phycisphaerae bacterium]